MSDAMVTARMPQSKKEAGNEVLRSLGYSASKAINELYDRLIETRSWPLPEKRAVPVDTMALSEALEFIDGIARVDSSEFADFDYENAKKNRLISKGRASEDDFK